MALYWRDVDLDMGTISVNRTDIKNPPDRFRGGLYFCFTVVGAAGLEPATPSL